ncbi:MAG: hypothetical protein RIC35_04085 [Marinoscillum sp.]
MARLSFILTLLLFTIHSVYGQLDESLFHSDFEKKAFASNDPFQILLAANPEVDAIKYNQYLAEFEKHVDKLLKKSEGLTKIQQLEKVFYLSHRKKLSWYDAEVTFSDLFESGKYDCLTGTAFYSGVLEQLNIPYRIVEFDFHVFVLASADGKSILMEPTDPLSGWVTDDREILERINYHVNNQQAGAMGIFNRITLDELAGLQYYNQSVLSYQSGKLEEAEHYLQKAKFLYPSKRIMEMHQFFLANNLLASSN